ncbi:two-component system, chemotaxis family, response regulator CheY [Propionispora hippei DSM 15287]|uniref:Two-component system, chemotaxis family, response regulator CheY n=1 Tax=Propionispora hippei DSM 15287 TaxID=1123003 RepID=A0A1M6IVG5_9FIRM|nr:two-component system, chemotaxis family, response regulator CheY [Propionispora hippei DSM 15287]
MKSVLIIDDALFMRHALKLMLEKNGYQVVGEAENGLVGIQKYEELRPDIVTMDITMPEMDGITAIKKIKAIDAAATIVVITAMSQQSSVMEAIGCGAKGFIVKPFKEDHVLKTMSSL